MLDEEQEINFILDLHIWMSLDDWRMNTLSTFVTDIWRVKYWITRIVYSGGGVRNKDHLPSLPFADEVVVGPNPETGKVFSS